MDLLTQRASAAFSFFLSFFWRKERERPPIEIVQNLKRACAIVCRQEIKKGPDQQSAVLEETQEEAG